MGAEGEAWLRFVSALGRLSEQQMWIQPEREGRPSSVVLVLWGHPWATPDTPAALHANKKAAKARALSLRGFQCHRSDVVGSQDTGATYRQCPPNSLASSCCSKQIFNFLKKDSSLHILLLIRVSETRKWGHLRVHNMTRRPSPRPCFMVWGRSPSGPALPELCVSLDETH